MSQGYKVPIPYGPNGCQVHIGSQACRETQTLEIIKEFKRVYESKMSELNSAGGGDNVMAKVQLQQDWIRDLTQQNEMLVRAVEELEKEAADRVSMLERRLQTSAQVMQSYKDNCSVYLNETFQKVDYLQNDVCNLVALIKRVRESGQWNIDGLRFYTINAQCLLSNCCCYCDCSTSLQSVPSREPKALQIRERETVSQDTTKLNTKLQEMETRLSQSPKQSDVEELNHKIRLKDEELDSAKRRSVDIETDCAELRKQFKELEAENRNLKDTIFQANRELEKFYDQANDYVKERDDYKRKLKESNDALTATQGKLASDKQSLERTVAAQEQALKRLSAENADIHDELISTRRQSESLNQAQNETIQALQEALRDNDKNYPLSSSTTRSEVTSSDHTPETMLKSMLDEELKDLDNLDVSNLNDEEVKKLKEQKLRKLEQERKMNKKDLDNLDVSNLDDEEVKKLKEQKLRKLEQERDLERKMHKKEVDNLKKSITELEKVEAESLKTLEDAYEQSKLEISQQRIIISNLQEALTTCKSELNDLQQKSSKDVETLIELEDKCSLYFNQIKNLNAFVNRLQDSNLELEVKMFEYIQDVALLETRLLKYQFTFRMKDKAPSNLRSENAQLRERVEELECECDAMRRIVAEAKELHQSFIMMQNTKDDLQLEARETQQKLLLETQLKNANNSRIKELQQKLSEKNNEISRCDEMMNNLQSKLCWTVCQNNQLKDEINQLVNHINDYQQNNVDNDQRTDFCQKEIEVCKENLTDLKDKLLVMKGLLQQKVEEYTQLETEFCVQNNSLACLKEQVRLRQNQYEGEICELRCTVDDLQTKLADTEATCNCLREDYQRSQEVVEQYNMMEHKLQKEFGTNINNAKNEIASMNQYIGELTEECCCLKQELKTKEQQIGMAKAQIAHFKSSENSELLATKEELHKLRNELNEVLKQHNVLEAKNETLKVQLCKATQAAGNFERQAKINEHYLHNCECELQHLREVKERFEVENDHIRKAYRELCEKYQHIVTSVLIFSSEINDNKNKNEDLLTESRNLINNVRAWLEHQAVINHQISRKFDDNRYVIHNLTQQVVSLEKHKSRCESRLHAGSNVGTMGNSLASDVSLESEENITRSRTVIDNSDEYSSTNIRVNDPFTSSWLKKVESMTKELHRSSEYWESKMSDDYVVTKDK